MTEETQYLSFSGLRVYYRVALPESDVRSRVLLLSSPLINTFHWRKLLPELKGLGCAVALVDLPGFGQSDLNAPQNDPVRAKLIWGVLDSIDQAMEAPLSMWHLAAHGIACGTILKMTEMYPESVKSQIHISPTFTLDTPWRGPVGSSSWYSEHIIHPAHFRQLVEMCAAGRLEDGAIEQMYRSLTRPGARYDFVSMLRQAAQPPREGMGFCPSLALYGGRDPLIDRTRQAQIHQLLPEAELHVLPTAGHFPMETHSRAVCDYLRGWLRYND